MKGKQCSFMLPDSSDKKENLVRSRGQGVR